MSLCERCQEEISPRTLNKANTHLDSVAEGSLGRVRGDSVPFPFAGVGGRRGGVVWACFHFFLVCFERADGSFEELLLGGWRGVCLLVCFGVLLDF